MKLIVGLGNPGQQYIGTRHNLGFLILDEYRRKHNFGEWGSNSKSKAEVIKTPDLILARPLTYMNNSGLAVKFLAGYYKIKPEDIVVIYDELDLHIGQIKLRLGGAAAGHHGVESIIKHLGTDKFIRVRCGIGHWRTAGAERKGPAQNMDSYVLEPFTDTEVHEVKKIIKTAIKAIDTLLDKGLEKTQNQYH